MGKRDRNNMFCFYPFILCSSSEKVETPPADIQTTLEFLYMFVTHSGLPRSEITDNIPESVIHLFETLTFAS